MQQILPWYNQELSWLRHSSERFARQFPNVAGALRLHGAGCDDPHVERLLEAFAFQTARISRRLDEEAPLIAESLLDQILPTWLAPVPSMGILKCGLGAGTANYVVPRGQVVFSEPVDGVVCQFRTSQDTHLWPVSVTRAQVLRHPLPVQCPKVAVDSAACLVVQLETPGGEDGVSFGELEDFTSLRFYLHATDTVAHTLYETLHNDVVQTVADLEGSSPRPVEVQPVGFDPAETLLPRSPRVPQSLHLLREYFAFPRKFLFADITGLDKVVSGKEGRQLTLYFYLSRVPQDLERFIKADTFQLGCTPIINLFPQTAEPILLDQRRESFSVIPSASAPQDFEVFSVDRVLETNDGQTRELAPAFGAGLPSHEPQTRFWLASRHQAGMGVDGDVSEVNLSVVDRQLNTNAPADSVLTVETTCLNGTLPTLLPLINGQPRLLLDSPGPVEHVSLCSPLTPVFRPPLLRSAVWPLLSILTTSHLAVSSDELSLQAMRARLEACEAFCRRTASFPSHALQSLSSETVAARLPARLDGHDISSGASGFATGSHVTLTCDETAFAGTGLFLFATVLNRFLAEHARINSFTTLSLTTPQRGTLRKWTPRAGRLPLV